MNDTAPNSTAARTALWRALHVQLDPKPHILHDTLGLQLLNPQEDWHKRPDMDAEFTRRVRLSIVTRTRFVEDLVEEKWHEGIDQYIILGAGLDTFALRKPELAAKLKVFEIDDEPTLEWKQKRISEIGMVHGKDLHYVSVDFEKDESWLDKLGQYGFDPHKPALIACTGVSLYLTQEAIVRMFQQITQLHTGTILAMTFLLHPELVDDEDLGLLKISINGAARSGHPFRSFFSHSEIIALTQQGGFGHAEVVDKKQLVTRYFTQRNDKLDPASGEDFVLAYV